MLYISFDIIHKHLMVSNLFYQTKKKKNNKQFFDAKELSMTG